MKRLAVAIIVLAVLATFAVAVARGRAERGAPAPAVTEREAALDRRDHAAAVALWPDAYGAAFATRSWPALLAAADASLRIGDVTATRQQAIAKARRLYLHAFFRARAEHSASGMVHATERFVALGDREVAAQCLAAARDVIGRDAAAIARLDAVASRLAVVATTTR
jgi:hypothetical protein